MTSHTEEEKMIIVAGHSKAKTTAERDANVAAFVDMVKRARVQNGCIDFAISADAADPERSNILEIWRDEQAWKAWQKIAKAPGVKRGVAEVSVYQSEKAEKPF
jgi:quinol monooxygenase YgiN